MIKPTFRRIEIESEEPVYAGDDFQSKEHIAFFREEEEGKQGLSFSGRLKWKTIRWVFSGVMGTIGASYGAHYLGVF